MVTINHNDGETTNTITLAVDFHDFDKVDTETHKSLSITFATMQKVTLIHTSLTAKRLFKYTTP